MRNWKKAKARFPNIRGEEEIYFHNLLCIEQQIVYTATKYGRISGEEIDLALAACGLNVVAQLDGRERPEFVEFSAEVMELVKRCMSTFDPAYNPEVAETARNLWQDPEDEKHHYRTMGSVIRRLSDSCQFWTKEGGRNGYIRFVTSFLQEENLMPESDKIHFTIGSKNIPTEIEKAFEEEEK
jgi:hypothetical protein